MIGRFSKFTSKQSITNFSNIPWKLVEVAIFELEQDEDNNPKGKEEDDDDDDEEEEEDDEYGNALILSQSKLASIQAFPRLTLSGKPEIIVFGPGKPFDSEHN